LRSKNQDNEGEDIVAEEIFIEKWLFDDELESSDSFLSDLIRYETERQARQIIMIPSESICSAPVRKVLDTPFSCLYAEGYPSTSHLRRTEEQLADLSSQLVHHRRYADRRFYKGNAYVNLVELVCRRRAAQCFATRDVPADRIFANVQPLSGAAANMAVYEAFLQNGDTLMSMDLMQGGHLSHGSEFHTSGKRYNIVSYGVNRATGLLDYEEIRKIATEHKPRMLVGGYTSYPWAPDWTKLHEIARESGALLMADIAHPAGMVIAGAYPSPIGYADIICFTTHKTLMGPRAAAILTTDEKLAQAVDTAVFPGKQGGPHINSIAALAVAFKLAQTDKFKALQRKIVKNAFVLADELRNLGLTLAYGGTDTHLMLVDLKPLAKKSGAMLYGEPAVRILELCGIVANKNTIPGDALTAMATGIRLGTPWITQCGAGEEEIKELAAIIHKVLTGIEPFIYQGVSTRLPRGKVELRLLDEATQQVEALAAKLHPKSENTWDYPHCSLATPKECGDGCICIRISGDRAQAYLQNLLTIDLTNIKAEENSAALMLDGHGSVIEEVIIGRCTQKGDSPYNDFVLKINAAHSANVLNWMRGHADGYLLFEPTDITAKIEGPVVITELLPDDSDVHVLKNAPATDPNLAGQSAKDIFQKSPERFALRKPYFVGQAPLAELAAHQTDPKAFSWTEAEAPLRRTPLYDEHKKLGGRIVPFAGWEMPVRYGSTIEEHNTVRHAAGLFDVAHMGVFEISGEHAEDFIDLVVTNYVRWFGDGKSFYAYLLDTDAKVLDDVMVYRMHAHRFLMVVNAANEKKNWAWLNHINSGEALIDPQLPARRPLGRAVLKNLHDPKWEDECKVDLALQGPASIKTLLKLAQGPDARRLRHVERTECLELKIAGIDVFICRTGYTGESYGYEMLVHPDRAVELWGKLLEAGDEFGVKPAGLGARDSLRIEAGLPLYGHELAGPLDISPMGAGFGGYVKLHKPFFIGKRAFMEKEAGRDKIVVRFRVAHKGSKPLKIGDPASDARGAFAGHVSSCAVDGQGMQLGLAYVLKKYETVESLMIFPLPPKNDVKLPTPLDFKAGERMTLPVEAKIIERFPLREKVITAE
jgi:glycine hydroxymethyltransferase